MMRPVPACPSDRRHPSGELSFTQLVKIQVCVLGYVCVLCVWVGTAVLVWGWGGGGKHMHTTQHHSPHSLADLTIEERGRLGNARCGLKWLRKQRADAEEHDSAMATVTHKSAALSQKRGSKTTEDNRVMFEKIRNMFEDHYKRGILRTKYPHSSQVQI